MKATEERGGEAEAREEGAVAAQSSRCRRETKDSAAAATAAEADDGRQPLAVVGRAAVVGRVKVALLARLPLAPRPALVLDASSSSSSSSSSLAASMS